MKSMTGFAKRQSTINGKVITVEIKSLNSKQMDANVKIPARYREKELAIRSMLNSLERGKIDFIMSEENSNAASNCLNRVMVEERYKAAVETALEIGSGIDEERIMAIILRQQECWENNDVTQSTDEEWQLVANCINDTIAELDASRLHEGEILKIDFVKHIDAIETLSKEIPAYESQRIETAKERMRSWLNECHAEIDENRFEQELIYYLEKLDITEEKVRLAKHLNYFREVMDNEATCGKKLGFIAQEMGREINTTGSKANHVEIQRLVVGMKDELEKIKEQLGNIL